MNAETRLGFVAGLGAYFIWGSLPLYIRLVDLKFTFNSDKLLWI